MRYGSCAGTFEISVGNSAPCSWTMVQIGGGLIGTLVIGMLGLIGTQL